VPIADGIEDLQFAYACDGCVVTAPNPALPDDIIDDQPATAAGFDAADFIFDSTWAAAPVIPDTIRLVRVSLVSRELQVGGTSEMGTLAVNSPNALQVEDHNHGNWFNASYQQFRRRVVTRTIEIRNLGL
jgi:type IV pilus assembly protein PilW